MEKKYSFGRIIDVIIAASVGVVALIVYFATKAGYSFPSIDGSCGARLEVLWKGLDSASQKAYPLMETLSGFFGSGNASACVYGALSAVLVFILTSLFIRFYVRASEKNRIYATFLSRLGGIMAAAVFIFTPAVHEAATHLEPRLYATFWMLLMTLVIGAYPAVPKKISLVVPVVAGWMCGVGLCDSPLFLALLPVHVILLWMLAQHRRRKPWICVATFVLVFIMAFFIRAVCVADEFVPFLRGVKASFMGYMEPEGWLFVLLFATIPFFVSVLAGRRSLRETGYIAQSVSHAALTLATIIAIATPLSPSSQMAKYAILPVAASAFTAFTAGYLAAYWWLKMRTEIILPESEGNKLFPRISRQVALVMFSALAIVAFISLVISACSFDSQRGSFADRVAAKVLDDMGERSWFVTDGTLDDHLMLAAARRGKELHLISLVRDKDEAYLKRLSDAVREAKLGGDKNGDLLIWLDALGPLTFVQHWFESSPDEVRKSAVIWGYPDLAPGVECPPEFLFFGADPSREVDWPKEWAAFDSILGAADGWGSYKLWQEKNPMDRIRLGLRRHMGLIANNYAVMLSDKGRTSEAFAMYELVLNKIDADNICALINEIDLASAGVKEALAKQRTLQGKIQAIVADPKRRYDPRMLNAYYGYVRNPQMFSTIGLALARSGNTAEALKNLSRAMSLMDADKRGSMLNAMAAIYADSSDLAHSREIYEDILKKDPQNHDALVGMMRLSLMQGDQAAALKFLEKACDISGDDPRAYPEKAMLAMMKGDLAAAKALLGKATDANPANMAAWSLLAGVVLQQYDAATDEKLRTSLMKELEDVVIPAMDHEAKGPTDYHVQTVRAQVLLRKGDAESRKDARDALVVAASMNPAAADASRATDMILGLDISMNDTQDAERQAVKVLRRNSKAPLANYVMGSLALQRGDYVQAEAFLRRSADAERPVSLAMNDLAEVLRRSMRLDEAEKYARLAVESAPDLYVAWETLAAIILERKGDLAEAEACANKACELSKDKDGNETDVRMLITLARVQHAKGDKLRAKGTMRKVASRIDELSEYERKEFEELRKGVK